MCGTHQRQCGEERKAEMGRHRSLREWANSTSRGWGIGAWQGMRANSYLHTVGNTHPWLDGHTTLTLKTVNLAVKAVNLAVKPTNLAVKVAVKMRLKEDEYRDGVEKKIKKKTIPEMVWGRK